MKLKVSLAVNIKGPMAIPTFIEGRGHYTSFGGSLTILDFRHAQSFADIVSQVAGSVVVGTRINGRSKKRRWFECDFSRGDRSVGPTGNEVRLSTCDPAHR